MSVIDEMIGRHRELSAFLLNHQEPSFRMDVEDSYKKLLVMSMGAFFETRLAIAVETFLRSKSSDPRVVEFGKLKGIKRQYHTWFEWERNNANQFFSLFGIANRERCSKLLKEDDTLLSASASFLKIGRLRNFLAHGDPGTASLEDTLEELEIEYRRAIVFVEFVERDLAGN